MLTKLNKNRIYILWVLCGFILFFYPLWKTGIIHNDELLIWYNRQDSIYCMIANLVHNELGQGRLLRILAPINFSVSFLTKNMIVNRIIQSILIMLSVFLLSYFFKKLTSNTLSCILYGITAICMLPYTFESSIPQVYVGLVVVPLIELTLSAIFFLFYLENRRKKYFIASLVLFVISLLGYEFMITYTLLFPMLYLARGNCRENIRCFVKIVMLYGVIRILYILVLLVSSTIMSGNYSGAEFGFVSIQSTLDIICNIINASCPGYYLHSEKYNYLFNYYSGKELSTTMYGFINGTEIISLRSLMIALWLLITLYVCFSKFRDASCNYKVSYLVIGGGIYTVIPILPNALSAGYQGNVGEHAFISLPVSLYIYTALLFILSVIIVKILQRYNRLKYLTIILIVFLTLPIQIMNETFAKQSECDYKRYQFIEQVLKTDLIRMFDNQTIYSPDMYKTNNCLAIRDGYWTSYLQRYCDLNICIQADQECMPQIYVMDEKTLSLVTEDQIIFVSLNPIYSPQLIQIDQQTFKSFETTTCLLDHGIYYCMIPRE